MIAPLERLPGNPLIHPTQVPFTRASGTFNPGVAVDRDRYDGTQEELLAAWPFTDSGGTAGSITPEG